MADELDPSERETLDIFLILAREVADAAYVLRANYVSAHVAVGEHSDAVVFTYDRGRVTVCGKGFEVDLSALPQW